MKKKHNGVVSIWKFIFALPILLHHFYAINDVTGEKHQLFICGAIAVDFFFIVSGCLLAKKVASEERRQDDRPLYLATKDFMFGKIKGFYPYLLFSFLIFLGISLILHNRTPRELLGGFVDLTLLQMAGLPNLGFVGGAWFLSSMIIGMLVIYPLAKKYKKNFSWVIAPLIVIFVGGYMIKTAPSLRDAKAWIIFTTVGNAKAIFELAAGCIVYEISEWLKTISFTKIGKFTLSLIGTLSLAFVISVNLLKNDVRSFDWLFIMCLMLGVSIAFSEQTLFFNLADNRLFFFLEKVSAPLFLNNFVFIKITNEFAPFCQMAWADKCKLVFVGAILLSVVELYIIDGIQAVWRKIKKPIKGIFIVDKTI